MIDTSTLCGIIDVDRQIGKSTKRYNTVWRNYYMKYSKLPPIREDTTLALSHFPSRFHAAVFRLWETVAKERIAKALEVSVEEVQTAADEMGLPTQKYNEKWATRGYITTIRNAWHILPYDQLLRALDWTEDQLAVILKEDDFLDVKMGWFKPHCEPVKPEPLNEEQKKRLLRIKETVKDRFGDWFTGEEPFDFFKNEPNETVPQFATDGLRLIYSYCGLYASVLESDSAISVSYPDELLKMYQKAGVNAVWLPVALYQIVPFPFDESYSKGWQDRQRRLQSLIELAGKYGIKVYLYLNEPRCMPLYFFEQYPELLGGKRDLYGAMCSSDPRVIQYLRYGVRTLCQSVKGLGGFFVISMSENLTHCKSVGGMEACPRCKDTPVSKLVSDVLCAISEESRAVDPTLRTIAWTWAWDHFMTKQEIRDTIDAIPTEIILQTNSEASKEYTIGGISGTVADYSISIPGPSELAKGIWKYAREKGHEVSAKVQINNSWECSTVPFMPVFDLIREHMIGLREVGVRHLLLSWTLGGYPSISLQVASSCIQDPSIESYRMLLKNTYGDHASAIERAATLFSDAFREFPFQIQSLYHGPQNPGPSNLLWLTPSGFKATMTGYCFDDLDQWRTIYPRDVYTDQFRKLSEKWKEGLQELQAVPDGCDFKQMALACYALFRSSYLQCLFILKRDAGDREALPAIVKEEKEITHLLYSLMLKNNLFGYEAANHYYYNKGMLVEKVINCEYIEEQLS